MEYGDLLKSGMGAIIGFALAQIVNFSQIGWRWWRRPVLKIESIRGDYLLMEHITEVAPGEYAEAKEFGFVVRNTGRGIATGVQFHLTRIETRSRNATEFHLASEHTYTLQIDQSGTFAEDRTRVTLVPGTSVIVKLATWREAWDCIYPSITPRPEYYQDALTRVAECKFVVVVFDDTGSYDTQEILVKPPDTSE